MGSVPQTLVGTAPWVPGAGTAQVRNAPSHEAGALKAQCAGERTGSPSKPSAQRPLQTRPVLARRQEQTGRRRLTERGREDTASFLGCFLKKSSHAP